MGHADRPKEDASPVLFTVLVSDRCHAEDTEAWVEDKEAGYISGEM